ncbi:MAG TPA: arginine deiminase-related protein [Chitinophagales bacterium]|jgi:hypothetical protein|nr:amidinotransferase [Chitinophagales bacterium]MBP6153971.1 amidinotransferase [Chitinophagales bacterium]HQV79280.1 arginine deiminase-related protein [Chitinophagales bacterium]HQW80170.1 arginine deiminase-related protein [Chitinophagales bacterium]HRB67716.1 arginine deiminase-related protein [Chitinophagales bacterium]
MAKQYTSHLLMVRPACFQFNVETAASNLFQNQIENLSKEEIKQKAVAEFDAYVNKLQEHLINVTVIQDTKEPAKPDAIFPNNWISMHDDGTIYIYPMCTPNRRLEVRPEIIDDLRKKFKIQNIVDLTFYTKQNIYLEGTGSILFDHLNKIAYACLSPRTNQDLFEQLCIKLGYQAFSFSAYNEQDVLIYHTNVMLTIGDKFAVICLESIKNELERNTIKQQLEQTGHEIIDINFEQMNAFAGNMLQVENEDGKTYLVMSETSYDSLNIQQIKQINKHTSILSVEIPTIEQIGGGSARCMLAEIYLAVK